MVSPIDPGAKWPGDNMDPDQIEQHAGKIRTIGTNVSTTGGDVAKAWSGLRKGYHAPEQETLLGAMKPAHQAATDFGTDMDKVATALETFAGEVRTIKANIAKIRTDAWTFVAGIHDGKVTVSHTAVTGGYAGYERGQTKTTHEDVDWQSDTQTVAANNALVHRLHDQEEQLTRAERTCANAIRDLYGAPHIYAASASNPNGYGLNDIPDNAPEPWGTAVDVKEGCGDKVADGVMIDGVMNGLGGFIGFHYTPVSALGPEKLGFSWSTAGQHWMGLGQTAQGLVNPLTPALAFLPGPVGRWFNGSYEAATGFVPGMLGIDVFKHDPNKKWISDWNTDPLHNWKDNPARTAGSVGFNVVTLAIPGPKGLGALTKGGEAARAAEEAGEVGNASRAADGLGDLGKVSGGGADLSRVAGDATKGDLANLGKNAGDVGDGLKGLDKTDIDIPNAPHDNVNIDHPNTGDHAPGDAPPARDPGTVPEHQPAGTHPGTAPHDVPAQPGHDGGSGHNTPGQHSNPADHTPKTDPSVPKSDPTVAAEVKQIQHDIQPHLQDAANDSWNHALARAKAEGVKPTAQRLGSYAHKYLDDWVKQNADRLVDEHSGYRIRSETSFNDLGDPVPAGTSGSIRPDIVIERLNKHGGYDVVQAYDLKTGNAKITTGWESKVQTWLHPVGPTETLRPGAAAPVGASAGGR